MATILHPIQQIPLPLFALARNLVVAALVTAGLLLLMQRLIHNDDAVPEAAVQLQLTPWLMVPEDLKVPPKTKPEPPVPPVPPPPVTVQPVADTITIGGGVSFEGPVISKPTDGPGVGVTAADALLVMFPQPDYPRRLLTQGVEGWVLVRYDVLPSGRTGNAEVVEADPARVFDRASLRAVEKARYRPKVVDGRAVAVPGVQRILRFEISKG